MTPRIAYKVLTAEQMIQLEGGVFTGSPNDLRDGFIHLSTAEQLSGTLDRHFPGQENLHLAAVDIEALGDSLKWEQSRRGERFPHLYAPLTLATVIAYGPLERDESGGIRLPVAG